MQKHARLAAEKVVKLKKLFVLQGRWSMSVWIKRLVPAFFGLLIVIQLIRLSTVNPPIDSKQQITAHLSVESAVQSIFDRSCEDCHSTKQFGPGTAT